MVGFRWLQLHRRPWTQFLYILAAPIRGTYPIGNTGYRDFHPPEPGLQHNSAIFCSAYAVSVGLHFSSLLAFLLQPALHTGVLLLMLSGSSAEWVDGGEQSIPLPHRDRSPRSWSQPREAHSHASEEEQDEEREFSLKAHTATAVGKI